MRTLVLVKPDAVNRDLIGAIVGRFEERFKVMAIRMAWDSELITKHYADHAGAVYFEDLVKSMMYGPTVAMIVRHREKPKLTVELARGLVGPYKNRIGGTIRGDYALTDRENSVHASDSDKSAEREIEIWFPGG